ncbi:unnamed protein product [Leptosia nina]|uniref:Uncharacterized protein n=1 Tax=Leptosia nina TaxID=320188 RepID=A0AAV1JQW6_9NEOP
MAAGGECGGGGGRGERPSCYFGMHIACSAAHRALATRNSQVRDRELRLDPSPRSRLVPSPLLAASMSPLPPFYRLLGLLIEI